jgi:hypothetical protein
MLDFAADASRIIAGCLLTPPYSATTGQDAIRGFERGRRRQPGEALALARNRPLAPASQHNVVGDKQTRPRAPSARFGAPAPNSRSDRPSTRIRSRSRCSPTTRTLGRTPQFRGPPLALGPSNGTFYTLEDLS